MELCQGACNLWPRHEGAKAADQEAFPAHLPRLSIPSVHLFDRASRGGVTAIEVLPGRGTALCPDSGGARASRRGPSHSHCGTHARKTTQSGDACFGCGVDLARSQTLGTSRWGVTRTALRVGVTRGTPTANAFGVAVWSAPPFTSSGKLVTVDHQGALRLWK